MTKERWTQVQALFESALERAPAEQTAFLRDACGDDTALYREVRSLLQVEVHSLLDGGALNALNLSAMLSAEGEQVGPYRIEREIGMGGMGTVYRAERHDGQFEQTVALKLIKRGMDSEAVVQRFQAERQLLARLEHPHIARLLDGGLHADGRPYFCMEYVEGEPITAYCDARALPVEARLRLFEDVCAAVRYAHQNLVVHRDLKPSNILVTTEGTVKLLDFGIAKLLDDEADGLLTRTGERVLTPAYAAPEQVRGAPVTTATDVYALGVVLYELLTGRRPHTSDTADRAEVEQAILTTEVERPSTAIGRTHTTETGAGRKTLAPEGVAHVRDTTPERLKRQLRGDLDTIVLKALRKEPERRYASAEGLLNDLRALRANQPIAARPDTVGYRLRKYVQRHRLGVLTTAGMVLLITTLVGFYTARLTAERDRARTEANKAAEVSAFLESLFTRSDPAESRGAEITARDLLAEGSTRIENELADQPAVQAQMYGTIGRVYRALGLHDQAEASLERSLVLHRATGADPLTLARVEAALGALHVDQGHFETADSLIQRALATQRAGPDGPREEMAQTLAAWAGLLQERGDYTAAEAPLQEALAMQRLLHAGNHETTATLLNSLGQTYYDLGQYDDAEQAYAEALAMRRRLHGALHPGVTESLRQFATLQRQQRRYDEAERLIREAIALDSQLVGLEHPNMGENFYEYASLLNDTGRFDEATTMFERTMAVDQATLGPDHPYVALALGELGSVRQRAG
ncbi:MAG: serine/threonine protein kinase, partial [Rhodothermaceae bacterium]|nr:serine/threonine protein kinase [Rhodothermaceae bacterium]